MKLVTRAAFLAVLLTAAIAVADDNLVPNGSFETPDPKAAAMPDAWRFNARPEACRAEWAEEGSDGKRSVLLFVPKELRYGQCSASSRPIPLKSFATYRISFTWKAQGGGIPVVVVGGTGRKTEWRLPGHDTEGKWVPYSAEFTTGNVAKQGCTVIAHNYHRNGKTIWYDDIRIVPIAFEDGELSREYQRVSGMVRAMLANSEGMAVPVKAVDAGPPPMPGMEPPKPESLRATWAEGLKALDAGYAALLKGPRGESRVAAFSKSLAQLEASVTPYALLIWTKSCWLGYGRDERPDNIEQSPEIEMHAAINETECASFYLTNMTDAPMEVRVGCRGRSSLPDGGIVFRTTPVTRGDQIEAINPEPFGYARMNTNLKGRLGDPLVRLNDLGILSLPPNTTREVFITVDTHGIAPKAYSLACQIDYLNRAWAARTVPVRLQVYDIALPAEGMPIQTFAWNYSSDLANLTDLRAHRINTFLVGDASFCPKLKGGKLSGKKDQRGKPILADCEVERDADGRLVTKADPVREKLYLSLGRIACGYGFFESFHKAMAQSKYAYMSDEYKAIFRECVELFVARLKSHGATYDDFCVQTWDEAHGGELKFVAEYGKLMREVDPDVRLVMDVVCTPAEAVQIIPCTDIWIMHMGHFLNRRAEWEPFLAERRKEGKIIGTYSCSTPVNAQAPIGYSRQSAWRVWKLGWTHDWFFADHYVKHWSLDGRPIPTRTYEARRQGWEDYLLLHTLKSMVDEAEKAGQATGPRQAAAAALKQAPLTVFGTETTLWTGDSPETAARMEAAHVELLKAAQALSRRLR